MQGNSGEVLVGVDVSKAWIDVCLSGSRHVGRVANWTEGPKPRLSEEQLTQFAQIVEAGPDREEDGVVRWRRIDLKRVIAERFGVDFHPRYVGELLEARLFAYQRQAASSGPGRADRLRR